MESPAMTRCIPRKSKKRVFPGSSSSCMEPEVIEISPPPGSRTSKSKAKAVKPNELVFHEIIDVDVDEDYHDIMLTGRKVESKRKRKDTMGISLGPSSAVLLDSVDRVHSSEKFEPNKKGKDVIGLISSEPGSAVQLDSLDGVHSSNKSFALGSYNFFDLDGATSDIYNRNNYDGVCVGDYVCEDDYSVWLSHCDNMDLPPILWSPDTVQMKNMMASATPLVQPTDPVHAWENLSSMASPTLHTQPESASHHKVEPPPHWSSSGPANSPEKFVVWSGSPYSGLQSQSHATNVPSVETRLRGWPRNIPSNLGGSTSYNTFDLLGDLKVPGVGPYFPHSSNTRVGTSTSASFSQLPVDPVYPLGVNDISVSKWHSREAVTRNFLKPNDAFSGFFSAPEAAHIFPTEVDQDAGNRRKHSSVAGSSSSMAGLENVDLLKKYENFKKFDTVEDYSDHYYLRQSSETKQPPKNWTKKIQEEWRILEKDLPDTIFVRAYESRMDLLRAVIIGAEGTPYHDGLFFFDMCFPSSYPAAPPLVHYQSGGLRINPNLYNCGKVCLSLLNTWTGHQKERWTPGVSTMLQVLVSIQGLILNAKPYFNEPGYAHSSGSVHGEMSSLQYNENTLILSLKTMVYTMKKPPKNFEDLVIGHFHSRVRDILMACKAYTEGVQVGCLVRGGVQDVDEGDKSCSPKFKSDVASYIKTIVGAFKKIGAKEAEEFLSLSKKKTPSPAPAPFPSTPITSHNYFQ